MCAVQSPHGFFLERNQDVVYPLSKATVSASNIATHVLRPYTHHNSLWNYVTDYSDLREIVKRLHSRFLYELFCKMKLYVPFTLE